MGKDRTLVPQIEHCLGLNVDLQISYMFCFFNKCRFVPCEVLMAQVSVNTWEPHVEADKEREWASNDYSENCE